MSRLTNSTTHFSNFGSLKSTETAGIIPRPTLTLDFSNFGSLKSTETEPDWHRLGALVVFQQFRLVEEH